MNLSQLQSGVWNRLGVQSSDARYTADVVTGFVNDALREIATEHDWPWLQATESLPTVASQSYVTPGESTTAWTATRYLLITNGTDKTPLAERRFDELCDTYTSTTPGTPQAWAVEAERIELRPIPDAVYTLTHGYYRAEKVLLTTQSPYLPDAYCPAACDLAVVLCLNRSTQDGRAVAAQGRYDRWLTKMLDNRRRGRRPSRIRVRPGAQI